MTRQRPVETERNGLTLRGTAYLPEAPGRHPAVLLLHGLSGHRIETGFLFVRLGRALAARGIAAVAFDFLHSGESDGAFERMSVPGEIADAEAMTRWLAAQPFTDRSRLGLLGFSLGGLVAACLNARTDAYGAHVLVAPTTVENLARHARRWRDPHGRIRIGAHHLNRRFIETLEGLDPAGDLARPPRPTLIIQGSGDETVPPATSRHFARALERAGAPARTLEIAGAGHTFADPEHQDQLARAATDFLAEHVHRPRDPAL